MVPVEYFTGGFTGLLRFARNDNRAPIVIASEAIIKKLDVIFKTVNYDRAQYHSISFF